LQGSAGVARRADAAELELLAAGVNPDGGHGGHALVVALFDHETLRAAS